MSAHGIFIRKVGAKSTLYYLAIFLLAFFTAINILYSQSFPALLYEVQEGNTSATISYLEKIPNTRLQKLVVRALQQDGNTAVLEGLQQKDRGVDVQIQQLTQSVLSHPQSPELYYNLSLLYSQKGMTAQAAENMQKAQGFDPELK